MALRIRLRRMGRKKAPTYRIVVAESSMPRDGRIVENIGHYNPRTEPMTLSVDRGRALHWLERGATPTDTVRALLRRAGVFRPEGSVVAEAAAAVVEGAKTAGRKVGGAAKKAAAEVAETAGEVVEEAREAVEEVVEEAKEVAAEVAGAVAGGEEESAAEAAPEVEAAGAAEVEEEARG